MLEQVKEYFSFSRKERLGIIVLLVLIVCMGVAPAFFPVTSDPVDSTVIRTFNDQLVAMETRPGEVNPPQANTMNRYASNSNGYKPGGHYQARQYPEAGNEYPGKKSYPFSSGKRADDDEGIQIKTPVSLFYFDPNSITIDEWKKLGVREKTAITIDKYRAKGGRFRKPEDLLKIFGLPDEDKQRLLPFVKINGPGAAATPGRQSLDARPGIGFKAPARIDINTADSAQWEQLPGIGSRLSQRIVKYRDKLGGFHQISQVGEVYGLADSVFQQLREWLTLETAPAKIRINEVSVALLEQHPYFGRRVARALVDFRNQHGPFSSGDDLKQLVVLTPELIEKMKPYLAF